MTLLLAQRLSTVELPAAPFARRPPKEKPLSDDRIPPQNLEAELFVLGSIMLDGDCLALLAVKLRPEHFYRESHGIIYRAALALFERSIPIDGVTLAAELASMRNGIDEVGSMLDRVGGRAWLASMTLAPTSANAGHYADLVIEKAHRRQAIAGLALATDQAYDETVAVGVALGLANDLVYKAAGKGLTDDNQSMAEIASDVWASMHGGEEDGVRCGFGDLDQKTDGGFRPEELVVIAARPGIGKTSLGLNIAVHVASKGLGVLFFSLEMSRRQLFNRMVSQLSSVAVSSFRHGPARCKDGEWDRVQAALDQVTRLPIYLDDSSLLDPLGLLSKARRAKSRHEQGDGPVRLIILDYLQLMSASGPKNGGSNREQEVAAAARTLKRLARELKVPVIAMAQFNREAEKRANKRPNLSDLRESGEIEQVSDMVLAIYREEGESGGVAELIILKHRNGPTGVIPLSFNPATATFHSVQRGYDQGGYEAA